MNLVHNAIVHNVPEGAVWVTTSVHADGVVLTVENTGAPLTPEVVATLADVDDAATSRVMSPRAVSRSRMLVSVERLCARPR